MPLETQLAHRNIRNTNLPYQTNVSPTQTDPYLAQGSKDILTSIAGYAERRPGFADHVEQTPTTFNNLVRLFTWDRFDGTFFTMACNINASGFAEVYKLQNGIDVSFVLIYTDSSAQPFDFVTSNNMVYFSNGNVAKKWAPDSPIGVANWGIAIGETASSVNAYAGLGANGSGPFPNWANPTNIQGPPNASYATTAISWPLNNAAQSNGLFATNYGFVVGGTNTITGIQVTLTGLTVASAGAATRVVLQLVSGGVPISPIVLQKTISFGSSPQTFSVGGASDTWGTQLDPGIINSPSFGVVLFASGNGLNGVAGNATFSLDAAQITVFDLGGPQVVVSGSAGTFSATSGYIYEFCYGSYDALGHHVSSPTPVSNNTGAFTNKLNVAVPLVASTDPQVNHIHVFRTTDGSGSPLTFFEIPTSPYPNTTQTITDAAPDADLNLSSIAPIATFNDPPTPGHGPKYFSGRIWMFNTNKVVFSGLEEITLGVPEESFPSGVAGNFWSFDEPVKAEGVAGSGTNQTLGVFCGGRLYGIVGNTLDTFQRYSVSQRRGCRNVTCTTSLGGMVAWLDSSNQIWATDGSTLEELSIDIRPDLVGINPATCSMTFHVAGRFHWLVFSTGTKLYVYDMDEEQWMPPWSFACQYIYSGEISAGNYVLMAATATQALQMNIAKFNDNGVTYQPVLNFGNLAVVPDFGRRFSYVAAGIYDEPSRTGYPNIFQITNNAQALADVLILNDEDPKFGTYTSIAANLQDTATTYNRQNGTFMKQWVYPTTRPAARWISLQAKLANADQVDNVYEAFMAYKGVGGR